MLAVVVMAGVLVAMLMVMPAWDIGGMPYRLMRLAAVCAVGGGAYFVVLALLGFRPRDFARRSVA